MSLDGEGCMRRILAVNRDVAFRAEWRKLESFHLHVETFPVALPCVCAVESLQASLSSEVMPFKVLIGKTCG
jgi:hypothetical protein